MSQSTLVLDGYNISVYMETKCLNAFTGNQNYYVLLTFEENNIISSVSALPDILTPRNTSHHSIIRKLYDAMGPKHKRGERRLLNILCSSGRVH